MGQARPKPSPKQAGDGPGAEDGPPPPFRSWQAPPDGLFDVVVPTLTAKQFVVVQLVCKDWSRSARYCLKSATPKRPDVNLRKLVTLYPNLTHLNLSYVEGLSTRMLSPLLKLTALRELCLSNVSLQHQRITTEGAGGVAEALPQKPTPAVGDTSTSPGRATHLYLAPLPVSARPCTRSQSRAAVTGPCSSGAPTVNAPDASPIQARQAAPSAPKHAVPSPASKTPPQPAAPSSTPPQSHSQRLQLRANHPDSDAASPLSAAPASGAAQAAAGGPESGGATPQQVSASSPALVPVSRMFGGLGDVLLRLHKLQADLCPALTTESISCLTSLTDLTLDTLVTPQALAPLGRLRSLAVKKLANAEALDRLTCLTALLVNSDSSCASEFLPVCTRLPELKSLTFKTSSTKVLQQPNAFCWQGFSGLSSLDLRAPVEFLKPGLPAVATLTGLRSLSLDLYCAGEEELMVSVMAPPQLESLFVSSDRSRSGGVIDVAPNPRLRSLRLRLYWTALNLVLPEGLPEPSPLPEVLSEDLRSEEPDWDVDIGGSDRVPAPTVPWLRGPRAAPLRMVASMTDFLLGGRSGPGNWAARGGAGGNGGEEGAPEVEGAGRRTGSAAGAAAAEATTAAAGGGAVAEVAGGATAPAEQAPRRRRRRTSGSLPSPKSAGTVGGGGVDSPPRGLRLRRAVQTPGGGTAGAGPSAPRPTRVAGASSGDGTHLGGALVGDSSGEEEVEFTPASGARPVVPIGADCTPRSAPLAPGGPLQSAGGDGDIGTGDGGPVSGPGRRRHGALGGGPHSAPQRGRRRRGSGGGPLSARQYRSPEGHAAAAAVSVAAAAVNPGALVTPRSGTRRRVSSAAAGAIVEVTPAAHGGGSSGGGSLGLPNGSSAASVGGSMLLLPELELQSLCLDACFFLLYGSLVPLLRQFPRLRSLTLDNCLALENGELAQLCELSGLQEVSLSGVHLVTDAGLRSLGRLPHLSCLRLKGLRKLAVHAAQAYMRQKHISRKQEEVSGAFLTSLCGLKELRCVALKHLHTMREGALGAGLGALPQLTRLEVKDVHAMSDSVLMSLTHHTGLTEVSVLHCEGVTSRGRNALLRALGPRVAFDFDGCGLPDVTRPYAQPTQSTQAQLIGDSNSNKPRVSCQHSNQH